MDIKVIDKEFAVCKINDITEVNFNDSFALSARLMRNYRLYAQASLFRKKYDCM